LQEVPELVEADACAALFLKQLLSHLALTVAQKHTVTAPSK
jgi:hypothetical protein